jgi:hypothetical protein
MSRSMRNLRALNVVTSHGDEKSPGGGSRRQCYVGCLTARRRNDPKQAGLSIQCRPVEPFIERSTGSAAERVGIDDESDQVT